MNDSLKHADSLPPEQQAIRAKCFHPSGAFVELKKEEIEQSIPDRFEQIVTTHSGRLAVKTNRTELTYDELNRTANHVAHALLARHGMWRSRSCCFAKLPKTGERIWFNEAELFHPSVLGDETYQTLLATMNNDELPANAFYGDGSPIEISVLHEFRRLYQQEAICFPWRKEDVLLLDNMLVAHGRRPFAGSRKMLVAMGEPVEATAQWGASDAGAS